jgi:non-homologous end joining protein Ku
VLAWQLLANKSYKPLQPSLHKQTGNRIRYRKVDDDTGREVDSEDIVKAYEL